MRPVTTYALGLVACLLIFAWILLAPVFGLPFGVWGSTGESMGNEGMMIHVWVDAEPAIGADGRSEVVLSGAEEIARSE